MSSNRFHLAVEVGDLSSAIAWYQKVLGCELDMAEEGKWQDINFWGNELTLHASEPRAAGVRNRHSVEMGEVCVPHFGVHLSMQDYIKVRANVEANNGFLDTPYVRFAGTEYQQETFFVEDPHFNVLEIKHMTTAEHSSNPSQP
jgi:extradiol dioxygenase family protein